MSLGLVWIVESIEKENYFICKIIDKKEINCETYQEIKLLEKDSKIEDIPKRTFSNIVVTYFLGEYFKQGFF